MNKNLEELSDSDRGDLPSNTNLRQNNITEISANGSKTMMDISQISQNNQLIDNKAKMKSEAKNYDNNDEMSKYMMDLKYSIDRVDEVRFSSLINHDIFDSDEVLMILYACVVCFNSEKAFDILLRRNNFFKFKKEWFKLFS